MFKNSKPQSLILMDIFLTEVYFHFLSRKYIILSTKYIFLFFLDPLLVIMEYINGSTLQDFLKISRNEHNYKNLHAGSKSLSSRDLTSFAYQVINQIITCHYNGKYTMI